MQSKLKATQTMQVQNNVSPTRFTEHAPTKAHNKVSCRDHSFSQSRDAKSVGLATQMARSAIFCRLQVSTPGFPRVGIAFGCPILETVYKDQSAGWRPWAHRLASTWIVHFWKCIGPCGSKQSLKFKSFCRQACDLFGGHHNACLFGRVSPWHLEQAIRHHETERALEPFRVRAIVRFTDGPTASESHQQDCAVPSRSATPDATAPALSCRR